MEQNRLPKPGEFYYHFKDKLYQIIAVATHSETREEMVVYQALYGDFKFYVRPLDMFLSEVDHEKYPEVTQKYRFELRTPQQLMPQETTTSPEAAKRLESAKSPEFVEVKAPSQAPKEEIKMITPEGEVNQLLMKFLDAASFNKKLEVVSSNRKYIDDRLINDMAVALDCTVEDGPLDMRINGLITCLQAMCRFENKRLR